MHVGGGRCPQWHVIPGYSRRNSLIICVTGNVMIHLATLGCRCLAYPPHGTGDRKYFSGGVDSFSKWSPDDVKFNQSRWGEVWRGNSCSERLNFSVGQNGRSLGWANLNSPPDFTPRKTWNFIFCIRVNRSQNGHEVIVRWLNEISVSQGASKHMPEGPERETYIQWSDKASSPKRKQFPWPDWQLLRFGFGVFPLPTPITRNT